MIKYAVAGRGKSGLAAYKFLTKQGFEVQMLDDKDNNLTPENILKFDQIILSPGISRKHPAILSAIGNKKIILNEIDLAYEFLKNSLFVGVTGTNGKSTCVAQLGEIIKLFEPDYFVAGNIGKPLCEILLENKKPKIIILELSSYQLETLSKLKLDIAVLLNLQPDHLDRYENIEAYYDTKKNIFKLLKNSKFSIGQEVERPIVEVAKLLKIPENIIKLGLKNFRGLPHRQEILGVKNGVTYINDSKATNIEAALYAIKKN